MKKEKSYVKKIFKYQIYHLICYLALGFILILVSKQIMLPSKSFLGLNAFSWMIFSWIFAAIMQGFVLFFWRSELFYNKISKRLGKQKGFLIFKLGFILFALLRFLPLIIIAFLTQDSLSILNPLKWGVLILSSALILWVLYSVLFYFGVNRLFGADHFFEKYQNESLEIRGAFKYIPNAMYLILLLIIYQPALYFESLLALITAFFQHLFVWAHYFFTEKPDLKHIYHEKS